MIPISRWLRSIGMAKSKLQLQSQLKKKSDEDLPVCRRFLATPNFQEEPTMCESNNAPQKFIQIGEGGEFVNKRLVSKKCETNLKLLVTKQSMKGKRGSGRSELAQPLVSDDLEYSPERFLE